MNSYIEMNIIGLEKTIPGNQQGQGEEKTHFVLHGHQQVSQGHKNPPKNHRPSGTEQSVRQHSANKGRSVNQSRVSTIDGIGSIVIEAQKSLNHVKHQQGPHTVVGKALPHFGKEESVESCRVPEQGTLVIVCHSRFI